MRALLRSYGREFLVRLIRQQLELCRTAVQAGQNTPEIDTIVRRITTVVSRDWANQPRAVINATGVVLHTNLGRAPLSEAAREAILGCSGYCSLELEPTTASRGSRYRSVREQLRALTGCEDAHVVVNNASAITVILATLARGKEVIVSRGQAVEIGGGFRIPSVLKQSGARLVEVGTTNRTRLEDYAEAVSDRTAAILHVHPSNFQITGFTETVALRPLADLAGKSGVLLVDDNGSGCLLDTADYGLAHEPTPIESLHSGSDLVAFSADKLLGGPQAGIILGRSDLIAMIARHPLTRAMRPDKLVLAALSATLAAYLRVDAERTLPLWQIVSQTVEQVRSRAEAFCSLAAASGLAVTSQQNCGPVGGGSLPGQTLPTTVVSLPESVSSRSLRAGTPSVVVREQEGKAMLDFRTVADSELDALVGTVMDSARRGSRTGNQSVTNER